MPVVTTEPTFNPYEDRYGGHNSYGHNGNRGSNFDQSTSNVPNGQGFDNGWGTSYHSNQHHSQNNNWHEHENGDNFGQTTGNTGHFGQGQTQGSQNFDYNGYWNTYHPHNQDSQGSSSNVNPIQTNGRGDQPQRGSDQNIYVDSNYKLPGEGSRIPNGYHNTGSRLPPMNPSWTNKPSSTTYRSVETQPHWNQEETSGLDQQGRVKPGVWRGQGFPNQRPTNPPTQRPWSQGKLTKFCIRFILFYHFVNGMNDWKLALIFN